LLESQAEGVPELLLAHPKHHAAHAHATADMFVDGVWCLFGNHIYQPPVHHLFTAMAVDIKSGAIEYWQISGFHSDLWPIRTFRDLIDHMLASICAAHSARNS
jgi:hypothetical protein